MDCNTKKRPNILWICTDQQRWDTLGCYGNRYVQTPALDRLAQESVIFDNAYCQSPVCTPSRGSFLSGRYPITSRTRQNGADIPDTEVLVTKILHDHGYTCGLSGKLHISACNPEAGCLTMEPRIDDGYDEFHWSHDTSPCWGEHNEYYKWLKEEHGTTYKTTARSDTEWVQNGMPADLHQTTWCADTAIDFITRQKGGQAPWLFSVNIYDPHHPFDPPEELLERYLSRLDEIPLPDYIAGEETTKTVWQRQDHTGAYNHHAGYPYTEMSEQDHRLVRAAYWAMCDLIDQQIGRMLQALEESGQRENTIVIFMSDHGELLGDHGIYLKGPFFYDCCVHVPLIMSWPGTFVPHRSEALVELMDIPQTLLELCGIVPYEGMQGKAFTRLLKGETPDAHHDGVYCEYLNAMPWHQHPKAFATMLRTKTHKLVVAHTEENDGELYDLTIDPQEHDNRYHDPELLPIKTQLMEQLLYRWSQTSDPIPVRKSDW